MLYILQNLTTEETRDSYLFFIRMGNGYYRMSHNEQHTIWPGDIRAFFFKKKVLL
jgi:hypothetical protein